MEKKKISNSGKQKQKYVYSSLTCCVLLYEASKETLQDVIR